MKRRMCVDFRQINVLQPETITTNKKNRGNLSLQPLSKMDEMYPKLKGAKFFTTLDLCSGYYHITLAPEARAKTAFITLFGKYKFNKVPFGPAQAPAYFQELIQKVIGKVSHAMGYLNYIIFSNSEDKHLQHISDLFKKLCEAELKLKLFNMCIFQERTAVLRTLKKEYGPCQRNWKTYKTSQLQETIKKWNKVKKSHNMTRLVQVWVCFI